MNRRGFLKDVTELGIAGGAAGALSNSGPDLAAASSQAVGSHVVSIRGDDAAAIATPALPLNGEWMIVRDPENIGREQKWFARPAADASRVRVPGIFQEVFPAYHGVVWYWREFTAPGPPLRARALSDPIRSRGLLCGGLAERRARGGTRGFRDPFRS